ncbi:MAG TPA: hypothetical protein VK501_18800 [Baekduia sp.]|uniref:hypothetical protein n=1 Tax=Baekduia sp. TaxID=2600305 RepID=UPI002BEAC81C|nr:hypothetical protein [Baekduia sp.]HMJ35961.1 hypothetical protein [Baekduia sp.]
MATPPNVTRLAALLLLAVTGVHEARFRLLVPRHAGESLAGLDHGAGAAGTVLAILASVTFAVLVLRALAAPAATSRRRGSFGGAWVAATLAIAAIFLVQEVAEQLLSSGAADAGVTDGLWVALALAVPGGLVIALGLRLAAWAEAGDLSPALDVVVAFPSEAAAHWSLVVVAVTEAFSPARAPRGPPPVAA